MSVELVFSNGTNQIITAIDPNTFTYKSRVRFAHRFSIFLDDHESLYQ